MAIYTPDNKLISKIYEVSNNSIVDQITVFKWAKDMRYFLKVATQMAKKYSKKCSASLISEKC